MTKSRIVTAARVTIALPPFVIETFQLRKVCNALAKHIVYQSCLQAGNGLPPLLVLRQKPLIPIFCKITLSVGVVTLIQHISVTHARDRRVCAHAVDLVDVCPSRRATLGDAGSADASFCRLE